jgi:transposase
MRKGFDSLSGLVQNEFAKDVLSGDIFIFFNQRHTHVKLLQWQGDGFAMFYKRLEKGTYEIPDNSSTASGIEVSSQQLLLILEGISLQSVKKRVRYEQFALGC